MADWHEAIILYPQKHVGQLCELSYGIRAFEQRGISRAETLITRR